jgi:hypothetical protein
MQLFVDEQPHTFSADPATTAAQLLASLRQQMLQEDRLITQVLWRGQPLGEQAEQELAKATVVDPGLMELHTRATGEVAADLLGQVGRIFEPLGLQQEQIADHLAAGRTGEAMKDLSIYIEAWQNTQSAVTACGRLMGWEYDRFCFEGRPLEQHFGELVGQLRNIRDALTDRDYVLLSDILTYELSETLEKWTRMLQHLTAEVGTRREARPAAGEGAEHDPGRVDSAPAGG